MIQHAKSQSAVPAECHTLLVYDDVPIKRFHWLVTISCTGGVFSDGFGLGIVGFALNAATQSLALPPLWLGMIGAGSLVGLFVGALLTGPIADRFGRRRIFAYNMAALVILTLGQLSITSAEELLGFRFAIGFVLGTDYVVSKALLVEFSPCRMRGRLLGTLSVAWAAGYSCASLVAYGLAHDAWRAMLATGAVPALLILPMRIMVPESPVWLVSKNRIREAQELVRNHLGPDVATPTVSLKAGPSLNPWDLLLSSIYRRQTLVGCAVFSFQVMPYFAVGTFISRIMTSLEVQDVYLGGLLYNGFLLLGAILGLLVVDHVSRRHFLVGSFALTTVTMLVLSVWTNLPSIGVITMFAVFSCTLSALASLIYVYLPELFPTESRASGIAMAVAASRVASASATFLLPIVGTEFGVRAALFICVLALALGCVICVFWAPETRNLRIESMNHPLSAQAH